MYSVLNKLSEYIYFYISKNITSYTSLLAFKIVERLQYILNVLTRVIVFYLLSSRDFPDE